MLPLEVATQAAAGGEAEFTDVAAVGLLPSVDHLVVEEAGGVSEAFRAHGAAVRALPGVAPDVIHQVKGMLEALDTVRALERLQLGVASKMAAQVRAVAEALVTLGAVEGSPGPRPIVRQERWVILRIRVEYSALFHRFGSSLNVTRGLKGALAFWPFCLTVLH